MVMMYFDWKRLTKKGLTHKCHTRTDAGYFSTTPLIVHSEKQDLQEK